jgi:Dyp-type peroxidase family
MEQNQIKLSDVAQAHLGRASWFADGKTRNWTLFFFFRILNQAEIDKDVVRLGQVLKPATVEELTRSWFELVASLEDPALMNAGLVAQAVLDQEAAKKGPKGQEQAVSSTEGDKVAADAPAQLFLAWLKLLTDRQSSDLGQMLLDVLSKAGLPAAKFDQPQEAERVLADTMSFLQRIRDREADVILELQHSIRPDKASELLVMLFTKIIALLSSPDAFAKFFEKIGDSVGAAGLHALSQGLAGVCGYELLRQIAPAYYPGRKDLPGTVRSEAGAGQRPTGRSKQPWDPVPINFTFTHAGLETLQLDGTTLASFPEAFKDGMAARAERLGDTGPSAPEYWYGALGLKRIHGYFTGGFLVGDDDSPATEREWQRLRDDVRAFNDRSLPRGTCLRRLLGALFRPLGLEIMHIELGEDPYDVGHNGRVKRIAHRKEHFGFRDGISQPFLDLELHDPPIGGGSPGRSRTWSPVSPGEVYLDRLDEDGNIPQQPLHPLLREGSTFVVFRKLEQDIPGFRIFLGKQRSADKSAQTRLASQFVGRWPNGTPLVLAPDAPLELGSDPEGKINDFLYAADDPKGANCPLGAHVRRTNPRDTGGTGDVRRHRILRRGIAYGGALLPEGQLGDGNTRGLLFVAVNSRIDLQFEVVQANWINKGELLGQAGLGRCPLTGANLGGPSDSFLEAGAVAPVVGLPRFVITRGGDYFFAPGLNALKAIADGSKFELPPARIPYQGYSMGDSKTPILFDADRLRDYAFKMLNYRPLRLVKVELPPSNIMDPQAAPIVFVARHADVSRVLSTVQVASKIVYSVMPYQEAGRRISRGYDLIIGTEPGSNTAAKHKRMHALLDDAWRELSASKTFYARLQSIVERNIEAALRRTGPSKRIDLVHDLPSTAVYAIVAEIFGTPGPSWLTEIAIALPFARQHFSQLHPDWLAALKGATPDNPGLATMQIWSVLLFADIVGNYDHQQELMALSLQAGSEFLTQLDTLLTVARSRPAQPPMTMVQAFVNLQQQYVGSYPKPYSSVDEYYAEVRMLLMELAGSAIAIIPTAFGSTMDSLLDFGIDLSRLVPILLSKPMFGAPGYLPSNAEDGVARLIYETTRLKPTFQILMRRCAQDDTIGGSTIKQDEWVAALVGAAGIDQRVFDKPMIFSLFPFLPGPIRDVDKYLLFGAYKGGRECWGRDRLALLVLKECVKAAGRLQGLRKVAGEGGALQTLVGVNVGLNARFEYVLPDWPSA